MPPSPKSPASAPSPASPPSPPLRRDAGGGGGGGGVLRAHRTQFCMLLSAKMAASGDMSVRPEWPAWCALVSGRVAAACVADAADVVILTPALERLGRLCMPAPVAAVAPLARGLYGAVVVVLRGGGALICDAADDALVPMRRKQQIQHHNVTPVSQAQAASTAAEPVGRPSALPVVSGQADTDGLNHGSPAWSQVKLPLARLAAPMPRALPLFAAVAETCTPIAFAALRDGRIVAWRLQPRNRRFPGEKILPKEIYRAQPGVSFTALDASPTARMSDNGHVWTDDEDVAVLAVALDSGHAEVLRITVVENRDSTWGRSPWTFRVEPRIAGKRGLTHPCAQVEASPSNPGKAPLLLARHFPACDYGRILGVSWAHDGRVVFSGEDDGVYVMDVMKGGPRYPLGRHKSYVASVATRDDFVVSAGWDGRVMLWSLSNTRDTTGMYTRFAQDEGVELLTIEAGRTFWGIDWPLANVVFASSCEASGRCLLHRLELVSEDDDSDGYDDSYATETSRPDQAMPA